jgi:hypothetical protein
MIEKMLRKDLEVENGENMKSMYLVFSKIKEKI